METRFLWTEKKFLEQKQHKKYQCMVCTDEEYPSTAIKIMDSGIDFSKERTTHESVKFRELRVAISTKLRYGFDLILPGVIFSKMDIRINHRGGENSITIH